MLTFAGHINIFVDMLNTALIRGREKEIEKDTDSLQSHNSRFSFSLPLSLRDDANGQHSKLSCQSYIAGKESEMSGTHVFHASCQRIRNNRHTHTVANDRYKNEDDDEDDDEDGQDNEMR